MAKIKGEEVYVNGARFFRTVKVNHVGTFTCGFPEELTVAMGVKEVTARTMDECLAKWNEQRIEYEASKVEKSIVIAYLVNMRAPLFKLDPSRRKLEGMSFCDGVALDLACGVYEESVRKNSSKAYSLKHFSYKPVESKIPEWCGFQHRSEPRTSNARWDHGQREERGGRGMIPYTPEAEAWFVGLCEAYGKLLLGLDSLFVTKTKLLDAIENNRLLIGAGKP